MKAMKKIKGLGGNPPPQITKPNKNNLNPQTYQRNMKRIRFV